METFSGEDFCQQLEKLGVLPKRAPLLERFEGVEVYHRAYSLLFPLQSLAVHRLLTKGCRFEVEIPKKLPKGLSVSLSTAKAVRFYPPN